MTDGRDPRTPGDAPGPGATLDALAEAMSATNVKVLGEAPAASLALGLFSFGQNHAQMMADLVRARRETAIQGDAAFFAALRKYLNLPG